MLFVQEEMLGTLTADFKKANDITVSVALDSDDLNLIMSEYDAKIDLVAQNKDRYSIEMILAYIGEKKTF